MAAVNISGFYRALGAAGAAALIGYGAVHAVQPIQHLEGRELTTYYDEAHILTYCDGETLNAHKGGKYTNEQCDAITKKRTLQFAQGVANALNIPVPQPTFEALTIFSYNIGLENFKYSTTLRKINEHDLGAGCQAMLKFSCIHVGPGKGDNVPTIAVVDGKNETIDCRHKSGGYDRKFSQGLANRHAYERKMCLQGLENDKR